MRKNCLCGFINSNNLGKLKFKDLDKNFRIGFSGKVKKLIGKRKFD